MLARFHEALKSGGGLVILDPLARKNRFAPASGADPEPPAAARSRRAQGLITGRATISHSIPSESGSSTKWPSRASGRLGRKEFRGPDKALQPGRVAGILTSDL